ncbi:hypothetical protein CK203_076754 [Vitis vinifera]|uniref:Uncharacterized protein n=1 Tax=Vitis vinifera TaxID=29760 RepID=A0A438EPA3_VITVI|nr:hypothetical protein CK203_076754 [Vitis vinifera]
MTIWQGNPSKSFPCHGAFKARFVIINVQMQNGQFLYFRCTNFFQLKYDHSSAHAVFVVISVLLFHFLITGIFLATCCW